MARDEDGRKSLEDEISAVFPQQRGTPSSSAVLHGVHAYQLGQKLGEGGQGTVYEAVDLNVGRRVAVKLLHSVGPMQLSRFKREFRVRRGLRHRGLVEVGELAECDGAWFLTMELVRGASLLSYVRGSETRLRMCFAQLASALLTLHAHGVVHRDVKSTNVLITSAGRLVLLDFGLAVEMESELITQVVGTPAYMAPEQWAGVTASEVADWYAFGVLLWEALTDVPLFAGDGLELWRRKTEAQLPRVSDHAPDAPADLASLCERLLNPDPLRRAGAPEVRASFPDLALEPVRSVSPLLGRERELALLEDTLANVFEGRASVVQLEGPSGAGKSTLLRRFREHAALDDACWVFSARCYEVESVPFNAFDSLLEDIARGLRRLGGYGIDRYRPRYAGVLARVFPALAFLVEGRTSASSLPVDPAELRERAVVALLEFLERLAEQRPVVLIFDDLHWADADSVALLERLVRADFAVMIVTAMREGEIRGKRPPWAEQAHVTCCPVEALDRDAARALVEELAAPSAIPTQVFDVAYDACAGSPYLLSEWASAVSGGRTPLDAQVGQLHQNRVRALPLHQQRVLATVALCGEPLSRDVSITVAECDLTDVVTLCDDRLLCVVRKSGDNALDLYHASLRDAALAPWSVDQRGALRDRIIEELAARGAPAEQLVQHEMAAGRLERAAPLAEAGAEAAERTFAFARAASLFGLAADLSRADPARYRELKLRQANAHESALCPAAAGECLFAAAELLDDGAGKAALTRRAAEQSLLAGDLPRGLSAMERALERHGLSFPEDPQAIVAEVGKLLWSLLERKLTFAEQGSEEAAERVALCTSIARSLHHIDLRGVPFALRSLLDALELGDTQLRQRALATFVMVTANHCPNPLVEPALALCREYTAKGDGYGQALLELASVERALFAGDAPAAQAGCDRVERVLLNACTGVSRELGLVRTSALSIRHSIRGDFTGAEQAEAWLEDADRRGDIFSGNWLRASCALMWLAQDNPARARAEIERAERRWPASRGGTFETACALYLDVIDRYEDVPHVRTRAAQGRDSVLNSPLSATELLQGYVDLQRAWGCLRECGTQGSPLSGSVLERELAAAVARIRRASLPGWQATADALEANAALLRGEVARAGQLLEQARAGFFRAHAASLAACALRRLGEVVGETLGGRYLREADGELRRLGVVVPERYARAYWSPFSWPL